MSKSFETKKTIASIDGFQSMMEDFIAFNQRLKCLSDIAQTAKQSATLYRYKYKKDGYLTKVDFRTMVYTYM